jgi:hypothetical protein
MGRKKVDKESIEYLVSKIFDKEDITGFQLTTGSAPAGIEENRPMEMCFTITGTTKGVFTDPNEFKVEKNIQQTIFGETTKIPLEKIKGYQKQFKELGYEVEEGNFVGKWYWFRIHCRHDEIITHVKNLKDNFIV